MGPAMSQTGIVPMHVHDTKQQPPAVEYRQGNGHVHHPYHEVLNNKIVDQQVGHGPAHVQH